jgi:hypothetical protein
MNSRDVTLRLLGCIFLSTFSSSFLQWPGLFGCDGLEPVHAFFSRGAAGPAVEALKTAQSLTGWSIDSTMDAVLILGLLLSLFVALGHSGFATLAAIWVLHWLVFSVGQSFLSFQWDILLMEASFLGVLLGGFGWSLAVGSGSSTKQQHQQQDQQQSQGPPSRTVHWMLRWLLFRLMFLSGVVKLQSNDATWWRLTALEYHYVSSLSFLVRSRSQHCAASFAWQATQ